MLERLLDIAVYALMAALVAIGVAKILEQRRDAQTIAWTESVIRAMDRLAGTATGYSPVATGQDMTAQLVASTLLPAGMIDRNSGSSAVLRNAFGGAVSVTGFPAYFTIAHDTLPPRACVALTVRAREWAQKICVNGTCQTQPAAADAIWASQTCSQNSNTMLITIYP
jgi:hypothetical protein